MAVTYCFIYARYRFLLAWLWKTLRSSRQPVGSQPRVITQLSQLRLYLSTLHSPLLNYILGDATFNALQMYWMTSSFIGNARVSFNDTKPNCFYFGHVTHARALKRRSGNDSENSNYKRGYARSWYATSDLLFPLLDCQSQMTEPHSIEIKH